MFVALFAMAAACSLASENPVQVSLSCAHSSSVSLSADPTSTNKILALDGCGCIRIVDANGTVSKCRHENAGPGLIALDSEGSIWIADTFRRRTLALGTKSGILKFSSFGPNSYPIGIATSPHHRGAWIIESNSKAIRFLDPAAKVNARYSLRAQPTALIAQGQSAIVLLQNAQIERVDITGRMKIIYSSKHDRLRGVVGSSSNSVWVLATDSVLLINDGGLVSQFACHGCRWTASAPSGDGSLWASDSIHDSVINIQRDGSTKKIEIGDRLNVPGSIVTTEDGTVWVEVGSNAIEVLRDAGIRS
jgi:streptogramin lyase